MKKPAIILCRVSDLKQIDGFSREAQEKHGLEYLEKHEMNLVHDAFSFVETASKAGKRTKFNEMLKFINQFTNKSKEPLNLIVEKKDRLTRNFTSLEQLQDLV